jgi:hypothetical protein
MSDLIIAWGTFQAHIPPWVLGPILWALVGLLRRPHRTIPVPLDDTASCQPEMRQVPIPSDLRRLTSKDE